LDHSFHYVGIRFLPTAFPQIFKINASELSNQFQPLQSVSKPFSDLISNNFNPQMESKRITKLLDDILFETIQQNEFNDDNRLYRRLFKYYIGDSPKTFSKVVRFQNILKAKPSTQSLRKNKLFYDLGYFDQAHFIKDFKNFYGVTPSKAFGRE